MLSSISRTGGHFDPLPLPIRTFSVQLRKHRGRHSAETASAKKRTKKQWRPSTPSATMPTTRPPPTTTHPPPDHPSTTTTAAAATWVVTTLPSARPTTTFPPPPTTTPRRHPHSPLISKTTSPTAADAMLLPTITRSGCRPRLIRTTPPPSNLPCQRQKPTAQVLSTTTTTTGSSPRKGRCCPRPKKCRRKALLDANGAGECFSSPL